MLITLATFLPNAMKIGWGWSNLSIAQTRHSVVRVWTHSASGALVTTVPLVPSALRTLLICFYCQRGSDGLYCFCRSFLSVSTITREPLPAAWWNSARTCLDNRTKSIDFQGHRRSKVKVTGPNCRIFRHCEIGQKACRRNNSCTAALSLLIFSTNTYTSTTSRILLNFKVIGQRSRSHGFWGVFRCAWYSGYRRTVLSLEQGMIILRYIMLPLVLIWIFIADRRSLQRWLCSSRSGERRRWNVCQESPAVSRPQSTHFTPLLQWAMRKLLVQLQPLLTDLLTFQQLLLPSPGRFPFVVRCRYSLRSTAIGHR